MKLAKQHSAELTQLAKLLEPMRVAMFTHTEDESLISQPMAPLEMDAEGAIWFFTDRRSSRVEHLSAVNLSFADHEHGTYVSLSGHGEVHTERAHIERLWTPQAKPWFPDGPDSPNLALLKIVPERAEYWDAPGSRMVRLFALAASVVAGKPVGLGDHGKLDDLSTDRSGTSRR